MSGIWCRVPRIFSGTLIDFFGDRGCFTLCPVYSYFYFLLAYFGLGAFGISGMGWYWDIPPGFGGNMGTLETILIYLTLTTISYYLECIRMNP